MSQTEKNRLRMQRWRKNNPDRTKVNSRNSDYRKTFGIDIEQFESLLDKQNGRCAVCGDTETRLGNGGSVRRLSIDHCHSTGKIRGLLCYRCNSVLGYCKDNSTLLRDLAGYVDHADTGLKVLSNKALACLDVSGMSASDKIELLKKLDQLEA